VWFRTNIRRKKYRSKHSLLTNINVGKINGTHVLHLTTNIALRSVCTKGGNMTSASPMTVPRIKGAQGLRLASQPCKANCNTNPTARNHNFLSYPYPQHQQRGSAPPPPQVSCGPRTFLTLPPCGTNTDDTRNRFSYCQYLAIPTVLLNEERQINETRPTDKHPERSRVKPTMKDHSAKAVSSFTNYQLP
jgi:hypothetical protein